MDGRRESGNVDDRRGMGGGSSNFGGMGGGSNLIGIIIQLLFSMFMNKRSSGNGGGGSGKGGCGCGGLVLIGAILLLVLFMGGGNLGLGDLSGTGYQQQQTTGTYQGSELEEELAHFSKQVFAGTEDVWDSIFQSMGRQYEPPTLVLFSGSVRSGCGNATSATGPFYCSADQCVYIDLSFFMNMKRELGADGDFAYAYVIAHEVGHHVQYLLGDLDRVHRQMATSSQPESNKLSVRLELQADFYAGVWAYHDNKRFGSLEDGDLEEAINAAQKIGDDYLQKQAQGYSVPDSFTHGTSKQRMSWLKKGVTTGNMNLRDSFSPRYEDL